MTNATTTQAYNPRTGTWATDLIEALGLPIKIFPEIVQAGTVLGPLRADLQDELGTGNVPVIAPATHDTGSAVAAVPATTGKSWAFLSSGTWSLMGAEVNEPIVNEKALGYNFTNEGGVYGTFRFLKNIMGLWLVQECKRTWEREGNSYDYGQLTEMAAAAKPFKSLLNPDDTTFLAPGDMPTRIADACRKNGQPVPETPGEIVRTCLESLALTYRQKVGHIEDCIGRKIEVLHVVGGGIQNEHLCQWTADATGLPVLAGPIEATAMGNLAVQAIATGVIPDLAAARQMVANSFNVKTYEPKDTARWDEAYGRFQKLQG
jgi:rhamnulokinase